MVAECGVIGGERVDAIIIIVTMNDMRWLGADKWWGTLLLLVALLSTSRVVLE